MQKKLKLQEFGQKKNHAIREKGKATNRFMIRYQKIKMQVSKTLSLSEMKHNFKPQKKKLSFVGKGKIIYFSGNKFSKKDQSWKKQSKTCYCNVTKTNRIHREIHFKSTYNAYDQRRHHPPEEFCSLNRMSRLQLKLT